MQYNFEHSQKKNRVTEKKIMNGLNYLLQLFKDSKSHNAT